MEISGIVNNCVVCGVFVPVGRTSCSKRCSGKLGGRNRIAEVQPKELKTMGGYFYYNATMLTDDEKALLPGHGRTILYHRLLMAKHLGRPIQSDEYVMHRDGDKTNNDISNLVLGNAGDNKRDHFSAVCEMRLLQEENDNLKSLVNNLLILFLS